jgi:DNA-directed RNA polymerase specialized sigma24 family protein
MLKLWKHRSTQMETHEEIFVQRYERLCGNALHIAAGDQQLGDDLVHEAYIQFTNARPDLRDIQNLDGYLYGMLRKLYMSHLRRASRLQYASSFLVDYDSLEIGLRAMDIGAQIRVQDELRLICHYACVRKESSKAGSVLLLRFFHGYYPSEIARVLCSPRAAVDDWLRIARREARLYIDDPRSLAFMTEDPAAELPQATLGQTTFEVLGGLRLAIFDSRHRECFPIGQLQRMYSPRQAEAVDSATLAQIVSCPQCLDQINKLLGLPQLFERYPVDMLGPGPKSKSGGPGSERGRG